MKETGRVTVLRLRVAVSLPEASGCSLVSESSYSLFTNVTVDMTVSCPGKQVMQIAYLRYSSMKRKYHADA